MSIAPLYPVLPSPGDLEEFLSTLPPYLQMTQDEKKERAEGEGWRSPHIHVHSKREEQPAGAGSTALSLCAVNPSDAEGRQQLFH